MFPPTLSWILVGSTFKVGEGWKEGRAGKRKEGVEREGKRRNELGKRGEGKEDEAPPN